MRGTLRRRRSYTLAEYALLLTLVALVVVTALATLGRRTSDKVAEAAVELGSGQETAFIHVAGIEPTIRVTRKHVKVTCTVTVLDGDSNAVSGATVSADWYVNGQPADSGADGTDGRGRARFTYKTSREELTQGDVVRLVVTDVTASGYQYDPDSNEETADEITVP